MLFVFLKSWHLLQHNRNRIHEQLMPTLVAHDPSSHLWDMKDNPIPVTCQFGTVPRGCVLSYQAPVVMGTSSTSVTDTPDFIFPDFEPVIMSDATSQFLYRSLQVTPDGSRQFECDTRDQAKCPEWFKLREHRITASNFKAVTQRTMKFEVYDSCRESLEEVSSEDACHGVWDTSWEWRSRDICCNIWRWTLSSWIYN